MLYEATFVHQKRQFYFFYAILTSVLYLTLVLNFLSNVQYQKCTDFFDVTRPF